MRTKKALKTTLRRTRTKLLRRRRRRRRAAHAISSYCRSRSSFVSNNGKVSAKLEALKTLIPSGQVNNGDDDNKTVKADQLFQETADYIILLRTRVLILQSLIQFYGSATSMEDQNDNVDVLLLQQPLLFIYLLSMKIFMRHVSFFFLISSCYALSFFFLLNFFFNARLRICHYNLVWWDTKTESRKMVRRFNINFLNVFGFSYNFLFKCMFSVFVLFR